MKISISINLDEKQLNAIKQYLKEFESDDYKITRNDIKYELSCYLETYFDGGVPAVQSYL